MPKDTLKFYNDIYEPLFQKAYTKKENRAAPSLEIFAKYQQRHNITIESVIDVGCAWGKTLKYWKSHNCQDVCGIDVAKTTVEFCSKKLNCKSYIGSATDLSMIPDDRYDLYMSTDVYEHLRPEDLQDALEEANRVTRRFIVIRAHPNLDIRKTLHLTVWQNVKWAEFFREQGFEILDLNEHDDQSPYPWYKNTFLLKVKEK